MNKNSELIAVRCQCGKKFRVRRKSQNAAVACPSCGQMINLSPAAAVEKVPAHWTENLLKTVWAIPACIAVGGILFIVARELNKSEDKKPVVAPVAKNENKVEETAPPQVKVEATRKVLFPGTELIPLSGVKFQVADHAAIRPVISNGLLKEEGGRLTSASDEMIAVKLAESVGEFEFTVLGDFGEKGGLYFLVGWENETNSGYVVSYSRKVNFAIWEVSYLKEGKLVELPSPLFDGIADSGEIKVSVQGKNLSVSISGKSIIDDYYLANYQGGQVAMGTWQNQYGSKPLQIKQIVMSSKPKPISAVEEKPLAAAPLKNRLLEPIFPGQEFQNLEELQYGDIRIDGKFDTVDSRLIGKRASQAAMELIENTNDFEITFNGHLGGRGSMYFLIGWQANSRTGYFLNHNRLNLSGNWKLTRIENGIATVGGYLDNFRIPGDGTLSLKVENSLLSIKFEDHEITKEFALSHYRPGAILMGIRPNQYPGKDLVIDEIRYRAPK